MPNCPILQNLFTDTVEDEQEHLWDELREKDFPNRVFSDLDGVIRQLENGLPRLASQKETVRNITGWPWIISLILNAT